MGEVLIINKIWKRLLEHEGEVFTQIRGGEFTYTVQGNILKLSRTNRSISRGTIEQAIQLMPLENTVPV